MVFNETTSYDLILARIVRVASKQELQASRNSETRT